VRLNPKTGELRQRIVLRCRGKSIVVAIGDFDNDGRPDLVVTKKGSDNIGILLGADNRTFGIRCSF
jgi:hypothetical protein